MDTSQNTTTTTTFTTWNLEKMETDDEHNIILHHDHQIPLSSEIWPNYHPLQMHHQIPSSSEIAPSSGFLNDILGIHFEEDEEPEEELGAMKEMMYKIAAMQPVDIDPATIRKPKRRNMRISEDPQSVAARHRREKISEKIRILQRLVPGGTKMDTASMLDEAIRYVKFLKRQIRMLQSTPHSQHQQQPPNCIGTCTATASSSLLLATGGDCPFNTRGHGHAGDGSSAFNHHEVISE